MRYRYLLFIGSLLFPLLLWGEGDRFLDTDLDGVADSQDLCPNTPFDVLVDTDGCNMDRMLKGELTLQIGTNTNIDSRIDTETLLNLYIGYRYKEWVFSLSSSNYNSTNLSTIADAEDDLFLSAGYRFHTDKTSYSIALGTKFAFMKDDRNHRDNDYFISLSSDYALTQKQNIFSYYSYTISSDSNTIDYQNFHLLSLGTGYAFTPQWYGALFLNYTTAYYRGGDAFETLSLFSAYSFNDHYYLSLNYAYGLSDAAYTHTVSLNLGVHFE